MLIGKFNKVQCFHALGMGYDKIKLKDWALQTIGTLDLWLLTITLDRNFMGGCKVLESSFY